MQPTEPTPPEPTGLPEFSPVGGIEPPPVATAAPPWILPAVAVPSAKRMVRTDDKGLLSEDVPCRSCGYNLRGLPSNGTCPECMTPVARSIYGDYLQFSDPAWVDRLVRGTKWIIIAIFAGIALGVIMMMVNIAATTAAPGGSNVIEDVVLIVTVVLNLILAGISIYGYWLVTSPDPASVDRERTWCVRNVARFGMVLMSLQNVLQTLQQDSMQALTSPTAAANYSLTMAIGAAAVLVVMALGLIGSIALFIWFRRLAMRIPRPSLIWQTKTVMIGYLISMLMMVGLQAVLVVGGPAVLMPGTGRGGVPVGLIVFGIGSCVGLLLLLAFGIWALVLLFIYMFAFKAAAAQARAGWALA